MQYMFSRSVAGTATSFLDMRSAGDAVQQSAMVVERIEMGTLPGFDKSAPSLIASLQFESLASATDHPSTVHSPLKQQLS